jgi:hypothetical protein
LRLDNHHSMDAYIKQFYAQGRNISDTFMDIPAIAVDAVGLGIFAGGLMWAKRAADAQMGYGENDSWDSMSLPQKLWDTFAKGAEIALLFDYAYRAVRPDIKAAQAKAQAAGVPDPNAE